MGFRFPLAPVLRFRESIEKREELALQKVQLEVARVRRRIDELTDELSKASDAREKEMQKCLSAYRLQHMEAETNAALEAKQTLFATLEALQRQRDMQMKLYQAAHGGRQMLTDLLTQTRNEWELDLEKAQQKRLDDIFASRLQRN